MVYLSLSITAASQSSDQKTCEEQTTKTSSSSLSEQPSTMTQSRAVWEALTVNLISMQVPYSSVQHLYLQVAFSKLLQTPISKWRAKPQNIPKALNLNAAHLIIMTEASWSWLRWSSILPKNLHCSLPSQKSNRWCPSMAEHTGHYSLTISTLPSPACPKLKHHTHSTLLLSPFLMSKVTYASNSEHLWDLYFCCPFVSSIFDEDMACGKHTPPVAFTPLYLPLQSLSMSNICFMMIMSILILQAFWIALTERANFAYLKLGISQGQAGVETTSQCYCNRNYEHCWLPKLSIWNILRIACFSRNQSVALQQFPPWREYSGEWITDTQESPTAQACMHAHT